MSGDVSNGLEVVSYLFDYGRERNVAALRVDAFHPCMGKIEPLFAVDDVASLMVLLEQLNAAVQRAL